MSFYLKYRPQKISELDLDFVREELKKVLASKNIPHAFLFSGPKGLGKTSAARILAKAINCESKNNIEPCNRCEACLSINKGTALDLIEIDAASSRGIDDIRELRDKIKLASSGLKYKVYVIDEVHMLTKEAFNALLKTLEEPPGHVFFILATTELEKLPETIVSRCLQIKFRKATGKEIRRSLQRVLEGEKLKIDEEGLEMIIKSTDGSFRDAVKLLQQASMAGKKITKEAVFALLTQNSSFELNAWLSRIMAKEVSESIQMLQEGVRAGIDLKWLISESVEKLHRSLLIKYGLIQPENPEEKLWSEQEKAEIISLIKALDKASFESKNAVISHLPLELAIMEWMEKALSSKSQVPNSKEEIPIIKNRNIKTNLENIKANWENILKALRPHNSSIEALLRSSQPKELEGDVLTIEAFYKFHFDRLQNGKCPLIIEGVLEEIFQEKIRVRCIFGEKKPPAAVEKVAQKGIMDEAEEIFLQ